MRAKLNFIAGATLAMVGALATASTANSAQLSRNWAQCVNKGGLFSAEMRLEGCAELILWGRETQRNLSIAYNNRGLAYEVMRDHDEAIADFDEAIWLDPKFAHAMYNRGISYVAKGDYVRAIASFTDAIRVDPKYALALDSRGSAYRSKGDYENAIADYSAAIKADPTSVYAYNRRADAYLALGDKDHAAADLRAARSHFHFRFQK